MSALCYKAGWQIKAWLLPGGGGLPTVGDAEDSEEEQSRLWAAMGTPGA